MDSAQESRQKAVEAWHLLNYFVGDLVVATRGFEVLSPEVLPAPLPRGVQAGFNRMCYSHLFVTLSKFVEFYKRYKAMIPDDCRQPWKAAQQQLVDRGVVDFRNKYVGHIWDRDTGRPLTVAEVTSRLEGIVGGDEVEFLHWINHGPDNVFPRTVISIAEHTRDRIAYEYSLTESELLEGGDEGDA